MVVHWWRCQPDPGAIWSDSGRGVVGGWLAPPWGACGSHPDSTNSGAALCLQPTIWQPVVPRGPAVSLPRPLGHEPPTPAAAGNPTRLTGRPTHSTTPTADKGYGSTTPSTGGGDIFCHARGVGDGVLLQAGEQVRISLLVSVWQLLICCQGRIRGQPRRGRQGASNQRHCGRI